MLPSERHFNQLLGHYGCYVVPSSSSNLEDASDATFQQPVQSTFRTLSCYGVPFLRCNIHLEQLRRCFGCYVPTAISINFQHTMDATLKDPFRATWKTLWMLRSNSHLNQLAARYGCYVVTSISSNLEDASDATFQQPFESTSRTHWMLRCTIATL